MRYIFMKLALYLRLVLILFCALFSLSSYAINFPNKPINTNFYVDDAGIMSVEAANQVNKTIGALWREKQIPMIVVTIPSLAAENADNITVDEYATLLFNHWGLGSQQNNNGILFLVSKGDRHARIEFGASWGHTYDSQAKVIMDTAIVPAFKQGDYPTGIVSGVNDLDKLVRGIQSYSAPQPWWFFPAVILGICIIIGMVISLFKSGRSGWAWIILAGLAMILWYIFQNNGRNGGGGVGGGGSGGMFGGGSSGGGGASGSW